MYPQVRWSSGDERFYSIGLDGKFELFCEVDQPTQLFDKGEPLTVQDTIAELLDEPPADEPSAAAHTSTTATTGVSVMQLPAEHPDVQRYVSAASLPSLRPSPCATSCSLLLACA